MASKTSHAGLPSPMDGADHQAVFKGLVAAGAAGMHNPPQKKQKKAH